MKAIVVDDSRAMRMVLKKQLASLGYDVMEAGNGQEALDVLRKESVGLAVVDWNMPVMSGIELVKALSAEAMLKTLRVLMVTSEADVSMMERALAAGAHEYLMKPFTPDALRDKLSLLGLPGT